MKFKNIFNKKMFIFLLITHNCLFADELHFKNQNYFIKEGYVARNDYCYWDDTSNKDECQDEIYSFACELVQKYGLSHISDVGCGSGYKLLKFFKNKRTVGYEVEPTLAWLMRTYPDRCWEKSVLSSVPKQDLTDLIICSDVIEHIVDPDELLNFINRFNFKYLVMSTPDRDKLLSIQKNYRQNGPPVNPHHTREWGFVEFECYVGNYFDIIAHWHPNREHWGQIIVAKKKQK